MRRVWTFGGLKEKGRMRLVAESVQDNGEEARRAAERALRLQERYEAIREADADAAYAEWRRTRK